MVLGFGKQQKKAPTLASRKAELQKQRDGRIPQMRSPVLESMPQKRVQRSSEGGTRRSASRVHYAAQESVSLARPVAPRKRLPHGSRSSMHSAVRSNEPAVAQKPR